jgi:hypothetical protein
MKANAMAFTMHDPVALRRYIGRTEELFRITPGARARALLQQMMRDAERQLAERSQTEAIPSTAKQTKPTSFHRYPRR